MQNIDIISYKHNGELHRIWKDVFKIYESDDIIVIVNNKVNVIDGDGHKWRTREPAICYFFKKEWFNIICMIRTHDIYYYCNLSSPCVMDEEGLKYIDYDLDVKVFPNGDVLVLDRDEYDFNMKNMDYPNEIKTVITKTLDKLIAMINQKKEPFDKKSIKEWYEKFLEITV